MPTFAGYAQDFHAACTGGPIDEVRRKPRASIALTPPHHLGSRLSATGKHCCLKRSLDCAVDLTFFHPSRSFVKKVIGSSEGRIFCCRVLSKNVALRHEGQKS